MMKIRFSNHVLNDRADRVAYIATTVGFGKVIARKKIIDDRGTVMRLLTDTGVILVTDPNEECVLTMWIADPTQIKNFELEEVKRKILLRLIKKYINKGYLEQQNKSKEGN